MKQDIIVIGAGCAGMVAALEAHANRAKVALVDRGPIGIGTNSVLAGGGFAGPTRDHGPDEYVRRVLQTGRGINREVMVQLAAKEAPDAFSLVRSLGLKLVEYSGRCEIRPLLPGLTGGAVLVGALAREIEKTRDIEVLRGVYITEILKDDEGVRGVRGFDRGGEEIMICAPAVILATGGAGALYLRNDNQKNMMGQGYYLAAKAGLELWDMEFVQFYPLVIGEAGLPAIPVYPPYPDQVRVINATGEDVLAKYGIDDLEQARIAKRDIFSAILYREILDSPVYMDYHNVPTRFFERHPLGKIKFDFSKKPIAVSPAAHFFMGGVQIAGNGQTSLRGLFACGEVAWGLHGANRMGGNALTECVVFGRIAARGAVHYARAHPLSSLASTEVFRDVSQGGLSSATTLKELRRRIREIAWRHAGVVRSKKGVQQGLDLLLEAEEDLQTVVPQTVAERRLKEDLMGATVVLRAVLSASRARKESRGSFIHEDFPNQDDEHWSKNSRLAYDWQKSDVSVGFHSVSQTENG